MLRVAEGEPLRAGLRARLDERPALVPRKLRATARRTPCCGSRVRRAALRRAFLERLTRKRLGRGWLYVAANGYRRRDVAAIVWFEAAVQRAASRC